MLIFPVYRLKKILIAFFVFFTFANYAQGMEGPPEPTGGEILDAAQKAVKSGNCWDFSGIINRKTTTISPEVQEQLMALESADGRQSLVDVLSTYYDALLVKKLFELCDIQHLKNYLAKTPLNKAFILVNSLNTYGATPEVAGVCQAYINANTQRAFESVLSKKELNRDDIDFVKFLVCRQPLDPQQKVVAKGLLEGWRGQKEGSATTVTIAHLFNDAPQYIEALFNITGPDLFQQVDSKDRLPLTKYVSASFAFASNFQVRDVGFYNFVIEQIRPYMLAAVQNSLATANLYNMAFLLKFPFDEGQKSALRAQLMDFRFDRGGKTLAHGFVDDHMYASLCDLVKIVGPGILDVPNTGGALPLTQENFPGFFQGIDMDECDKDALMSIAPFIYSRFSDFLGDAFQKTLETIRAEKYVHYYVKRDFLKLLHMCPDLFGGLGLEDVTYMIPTLSEGPRGREFLRGYEVDGVSLLRRYAQIYEAARRTDADGDGGMKAYQAQESLKSVVRAYVADGVCFSATDFDINRENLFVLSGVDFNTLSPFIQRYRNSRGENWAHWVCAGAINLSDDVDSTSVFALFNQADHEGNSPIQFLANQDIINLYHLPSILRAIPELAGIPLQGRTTFLMLLAAKDISAYNRLMQEPTDIDRMQLHNPRKYANYLRGQELLNAACDLVDDYGHSARSIAAMYEAEDGVDDYSEGRYRRYSVVFDVLFRNACQQMPFRTDIWQKMGAFPYAKTNSRQWLDAVFERNPTGDTMAFFHQSADVRRRENVNRLWYAYFEAHDSEQQARLQAEELRERLVGHGGLGWIESEKQLLEAKKRMSVAVRCLETLSIDMAPMADGDAVPVYSMKTASINLLTGHSSFGFNPTRQATDDEACIMIRRIMDLTRGMDIGTLVQSFNQEPVDSLSPEGMRILKNHQRTCAEIAVFLCQNSWRGLAYAHSGIYKHVDDLVTPVFGEASSATTLKKRSEGGVIPDSIFDRSVF